jgi:aspartate kinase
MAAALGADACEILTDVDGVFTADPRIVSSARRIDELTFEEMLELAAAGARVVMPRAVEFGMRFRVPLYVASSFHSGPGTWVREKTMEQAIVRGIAHDTSAAKVTVSGVPDRPGVAAGLFEPLANEDVSVDMIVQNVSAEGITDISFTVPRDLSETARRVAEAVAAEVGAAGVDVDTAVARLSIVGSGMRAEPGVAAKMFRELADDGVNIDMISTSSIRVSCVIAESDVERAMNRLHAAFDLEGDGSNE